MDMTLDSSQACPFRPITTPSKKKKMGHIMDNLLMSSLLSSAFLFFHIMDGKVFIQKIKEVVFIRF